MIAYGDEIVAAGQAQRLYDADPSRLIAICDISGKPRWHPIWEGNPIIATPADVIFGGKDITRLVSAPHARPYIIYPFTAATGWTFNKDFKARDHIAKIYLTSAEIAVGVRTVARHGPYVLIEPYSKHQNLRWPLESWQALVEGREDLTFVQHIHPDTPLVLKGAHPVSATFRDACGLVAASSLYVRTESGMVHACAALRRPQVTIWGGCMDWDVLGGYPGQHGVGLDMPGSPCGKWEPCDHCLDTMAAISVEQVSDAITTALKDGAYGIR